MALLWYQEKVNFFKKKFFFRPEMLPGVFPCAENDARIHFDSFLTVLPVK
jgi:hypothetical protein